MKKFDDFYKDFYPYLFKHVRPKELKNKKVLEIGLGYGTLGQIIAESGADYYGLDIASSPVFMMNHRLTLLDLPQNAREGSILSCPFQDNMFDAVVSIGCFHHTGDVEKCFEEAYRVLKPGGRICVMLYNHYSLRQWNSNFSGTLRSLFKEKRALSNTQKAAYDANSANEAAPEVVLSSASEVGRLLAALNFSRISIKKENMDAYTIFDFNLPRKFLLNTVAKLFGLDLYITAYK